MGANGVRARPVGRSPRRRSVDAYLARETWQQSAYDWIASLHCVALAM